MSLAAVRPYFRKRLNALNLKEHRDAINFNNIPGTIIDEAYHMESLPVRNIRLDQLTYTLQFPLKVRLFKTGYNDTVEAHEELITRTDLLLEEVLKPANKLDGTLFNIVPGTIEWEEISVDNDNVIIAATTFVAVIKLCF